MYCQSLEWTVHVLADFGIYSACTVTLWNSTVNVLSAFRMDSACIVNF